MGPPIHEYLPPEVFSEILLAVTYPGQSHGGWDSPVQSAIILASVCRGWRETATALSALWSDLYFSNFTYPSRFEAQGCIDTVLGRSRGRFKRVALDFTSLNESADSDDVIVDVLATILTASLTSNLFPPSWTELSLTVAGYDQMCTISDHFLFSTSSAARTRLGHITALRLVMASPSPSSDSPSAWTQPRLLPRFNTRYFKSLTRIYLTHIHILIFPSILPPSQLQICLQDWTDVIEDTFIATANLDFKAPPSHVSYQLGIIESQLNTYPFRIELSGVTQLDLVFPIVTPQSARHSTRPGLPSLAPYTNITPFFARMHFPHLVRLRLTHITPSIWSAFLDLLRQPLTPNIEPHAKFEQLRELTLLFVRNPTTSLHDKSLKSGLTVGRADYDYDRRRAKDEWDQGVMMNKWMKTVDKRAVPSLENISCGSTDGTVLWRAKVNSKPLAA